MSFRLSAVVAAFLLPVGVLAQTLSERVPADAMLYVGWRGSDSLGSAYEQSRLKGVLEATDLSVLGSDAFNQSLARAVRRANPQAAAELPALLASCRQLLKYPSALYLGSEAKGSVAFALLCDAGAQAQPLGEQLRASAVGRGPLQITVNGGRLILSFAVDAATLQMMAGSGPAAPASLAAAPSFKAAMQQVNPEGVLVAYVNPPRLLTAGPASDLPDRARLIVALGLDNLNSFALSGEFAGKDWLTRAFAAAPAPRRGLLKLMDGAPFAPGMLQLAPKSATFVTCGSFDIAALLDETRASMQRFDARLTRDYDRVIQQMNKASGADLRAELAASLGADWLIYADPGIGGNSPLGWVLVNRPRDAARLEATLGRVEKALADLLSAKLRGEGMTCPLYTRQYDKTTVHCAAFPLISPAWAMRDGVLYLGAYPQTVVAAADFAASGKPSFATVDAVAGLKTMPSSFTYYDLPRTAAGSYPTVVTFSRYLGFADLMGVRTPVLGVPALPALLNNLAPATGRSWNDAGGWHAESRAPFPCSEVFSGQFETNPAMIQGPLMMSILLPSLSKARETANRAKCSNNLRQIGLAEMMYANENKQKLSPDFESLVTTQGLSWQVFLCPSGQATHQEKGHPCSYIYAGKGLNTSAPADVVLAYEPLENHDGAGANFLYADAHVEWHPAPVAQQMIEMLEAGNNPPQ